LAGYFFDSSALVKLYHPEPGTPLVDRIVNSHVNLVRLSRLSVAEMISAFAIKARTKSINQEDARALVRRFRGDLTRGKFEVFEIGESTFALAESLVERYAFEMQLRALDALQLAVALELQEAHLMDHFVTADIVLDEVARAEGLAIINPLRD
jgi:predicted nucleic acid-binding protein